jgi:hypothetical protein
MLPSRDVDHLDSAEIDVMKARLKALRLKRGTPQTDHLVSTFFFPEAYAVPGRYCARIKHYGRGNAGFRRLTVFPHDLLPKVYARFVWLLVERNNAMVKL